MSIVEVMVASAIVGILALSIVGAFRAHLNATGFTTDEARTYTPAALANRRIAELLRGIMQNPEGVTATPSYAVSASAITFRPVVRLLDPSEAGSYPGRVSKNNVLYESYAVTLQWDATRNLVSVTRTGTLPGKLPQVEVLSEAGSFTPDASLTAPRTKPMNVTSFLFFNGESGAAPDVATYSLAWTFTVQRPSVFQKGRTVTSDYGIALQGRTRTIPETLSNSPGKPVLSPP